MKMVIAFSFPQTQAEDIMFLFLFPARGGSHADKISSTGARGKTAAAAAEGSAKLSGAMTTSRGATQRPPPWSYNYKVQSVQYELNHPCH